MATLLSPGVEVTVVDESAYASPGIGTIPFLVLATRENKTDPTNTYTDGIAPYTKSINANKVVRVSSQRELTQFFGNAIFETRNNAVVEGSETSEYGLLAAYSYLGQGSSMFAIRADVDLGELEPVTSEPTGPLNAGTYWLDIDGSRWGIHEYNATTARWEYKEPLAVELDDGSSLTTTVVNGEYLVALEVGNDGVLVRYYKGVLGSWDILTNDNSTWDEHYNMPSSPNDEDVWIKTTQPSNGLNLQILLSDSDGDFLNTSGGFNTVLVEGVSKTVNTSDYVRQDGTSSSNISFTTGAIQLTLTTAGAAPITDQTIEIQIATASATVASITEDFIASNDEPTGTPVDGTLWYDSTITDSLDLFKKNPSGSWTRVSDTNNITYSTEAPANPIANDIWIDTNAAVFPTIYRYVASTWQLHDNTDQSSPFGVVFADVARPSANSQAAPTVDTDIAPEAAIYPDEILLVNMANSTNTVRQYDATNNVWFNAASNNVDGSGNFGRKAQRKLIVTKMQAALVGNDEIREESRNFTLLCAPNYPELTDELIQLNSDRGETAFIIIDTPLRLRPTDVETWINGTNASENGEDGLVTKNTYSAVYYPNLRTTTPFGDTVTVPASHGVLYQYAYNDNIAYPWFSPAGLTRGVIQNATSVGYIDSQENEFRPIALSNSQRDTLYVNKVNPIANFPSEGIVVFGDKTLHQNDSSLDRVNVARLVAYLRERFQEIGRPFLFEQNTRATRDRAKSVYDNFLFDIVSKRGVTDFSVVCDESNNTNLRIDRNELWIDVAIVPTKSINYIYIPIRLRNTGEI
jgi:hypothetical protein